MQETDAAIAKLQENKQSIERAEREVQLLSRQHAGGGASASASDVAAAMSAVAAAASSTVVAGVAAAPQSQ